jgi:hypothetical protein
MDGSVLYTYADNRDFFHVEEEGFDLNDFDATDEIKYVIIPSDEIDYEELAYETGNAGRRELFIKYSHKP